MLTGGRIVVAMPAVQESRRTLIVTARGLLYLASACTIESEST
jgi:hypothetical protein